MQPVEPPPLVVDARVEGALTLAGGAAWIASEALAPSIGPSACRWCAPGGIDASVRDAVAWSSPHVADVASSVTAFVVAPLVALGGDALAASRRDALAAWPADALVIVETAVLAADVNQATKLLVARERPRAYYGHPGGSVDDHLSFYSGHTTLVFSLATASGTVASLRRWPLAPAIWLTGLAAAFSVAYFRLAADAHYLSDVIVGAAAGSALGVAIPRLHAPGADARIAPLPLQGGAGLAVTGVWF